MYNPGLRDEISMRDCEPCITNLPVLSNNRTSIVSALCNPIITNASFTGLDSIVTFPSAAVDSTLVMSSFLITIGSEIKKSLLSSETFTPSLYVPGSVIVYSLLVAFETIIKVPTIFHIIFIGSISSFCQSRQNLRFIG